jgi:hypothetical protein
MPREQLLVLRSDELRRSRLEVLNRCDSWMDLPATAQAPEGMRRVLSYAPMDPKTRSRLVDHFRPHNARLAQLLGEEFDWDR